MDWTSSQRSSSPAQWPGKRQTGTPCHCAGDFNLRFKRKASLPILPHPARRMAHRYPLRQAGSPDRLQRRQDVIVRSRSHGRGKTTAKELSPKGLSPGSSNYQSIGLRRLSGGSLFRQVPFSVLLIKISASRCTRRTVSRKIVRRRDAPRPHHRVGYSIFRRLTSASWALSGKYFPSRAMSFCPSWLRM